jgi:hypothetical protein
MRRRHGRDVLFVVALLIGSIWGKLGYPSNPEEREQALLEERRQSYRETARARLESKQGDEGSASDYSIPSD